MNAKVDYVRHQAALPRACAHTCHWPGCTRAVPPAMWGCSTHWYTLPAKLRNRVWATYRPGQEQTKLPSRSYVEVAREVQAWIAARKEAPPA